MVGKNSYDNSGAEVDIRDLGTNRRIAVKRRMDNNRIFLHHSDGLYNSKMGEAAKSILNVFGYTGLFFAFISNIKVAPFISLAIGIISTLWALFRMLKMMEDWLIRRSERKRSDREYDEDYNKKAG